MEFRKFSLVFVVMNEGWGMDILLGKLWGLKNLTESLNSELCLKYSVDTAFMPLAALNMVNSKVVLAIELISHYKEICPKPKRVPFEDHLSDDRELAERLFSILSFCFVASMSSLESCAKKGINKLPEEFGVFKGKKVYWINIVQRSCSLGLMAPEDKRIWLDFINIRNCLVHNNGESDSDFAFSLPDGLVWEGRRQAKPRVTLMHFTSSLDWMVKSYACWCDKVTSCWVEQFTYEPSVPSLNSIYVESNKIIPL